MLTRQRRDSRQYRGIETVCIDALKKLTFFIEIKFVRSGNKLLFSELCRIPLKFRYSSYLCGTKQLCAEFPFSVKLTVCSGGADFYGSAFRASGPPRRCFLIKHALAPRSQPKNLVTVAASRIYSRLPPAVGSRADYRQAVLAARHF